MPGARTKRRIFFIAFAIAAILVHVCALPGHVHAAPSVTEGHVHGAPASEHDHETGDPLGDPLYVESCDAVRPANAAQAAPMPAGGCADVASAEIAVSVVVRPVDETPPRASPPLYLVHRALLI